MATGKLFLKTVVSEMFEENAYIAHLDGMTDCLVVDPGFEPQPILDYVAEKGLSVAAILNTHGHADHIAGNASLKEAGPDAPLVIGHGDAPKLTDPMLNLSGQYGMGLVSPAADTLVEAGQVYQAAGFDLEVRETPGHSCGHVVFVWHETSPSLVLARRVPPAPPLWPRPASRSWASIAGISTARGRARSTPDSSRPAPTRCS